LVAHILDDPFVMAAKHRRLRIDGAYARARVAFKAARFGRLRLPANSAPLRGVLRTAFERAAFPRGLKCPIEAAQGAWLQTQDERNIT
jgi:hypothetical protein